MTETFKIEYRSTFQNITAEIQSNCEKIVIEKCPSTSEAFQMIIDHNFKSTFVASPNAIAIVLKIDSEIVESEANKVQLLSLDNSRPLLIAFESNVNGKLIVFWRTKDMKDMFKLVADMIRDADTSYKVPSKIIIDSLLINCIKSNHPGKILINYFFKEFLEFFLNNF
jgi:phosphate uptake regulator